MFLREKCNLKSAYFKPFVAILTHTKTITLADDSKEYDFSDAIFMAYDTTEKELSVVSKGWNSLVGKGNATVADTKLANGATNEVIYVVEDDDTASVLDVKLVLVIVR